MREVPAVVWLAAWSAVVLLLVAVAVFGVVLMEEALIPALRRRQRRLDADPQVTARVIDAGHRRRRAIGGAR